jgi:hypothetical protein
MAGERQEEARTRLAELGAMILDEVAIAAAANPDSVYAQVAKIETQRRVSFLMNKFRKLGLIDYNGQLEVHPSVLNVVLHETPHINR